MLMYSARAVFRDGFGRILMSKDMEQHGLFTAADT